MPEEKKRSGMFLINTPRPDENGVQLARDLAEQILRVYDSAF